MKADIDWRSGKTRRRVPAREALERVAKLADQESGETNVTLANGEIVTLLLSPDRAFLLHMREAGDEGRVASRRSGKAKAWRFRLSNGQEDEYPDDMTLPRELALSVFSSLIRGEDVKTVNWKS